MIRAESLHKEYGRIKALAGVDLAVASGRTLVVFGPNGAGKTTLIRILSLLSRPTAGTIEIAGLRAGRQDDAIRRRIGVLSHNTFLYENLSPMENLLFYAKMYGVADAAGKARGLLERTGLAARADDLVRGFSRGMRQRLAIARCILHEPSVIFLDEPTAGLDRRGAQTLTALLSQLRSEGRTILMTTHDIPEGLALADEIAIMAKGTIVLHKERSEVAPDAFERLYLDSVEGKS